MTNTMMIRVISLARDVERREVFRAEAAGSSLPWSFFDAHTGVGGAIVHDSRLPALRRGRMLSPAELGCYSSHCAIWVEFLESTERQLVVLEDDTWVDWRFLENLSQEDVGAKGIHYLRLCALNLPPFALKGRLLGRYVAHFQGYAQGTQGYLLTRRGAERMLNHCRKVAGPIDIVMDQTWWGGLPTLGLFPSPVVEKTGPSRIGAQRYADDLRLPKALWWPRQWVRVQEFLRIRAYRAMVSAGFGPKVDLDTRWM